MRVKIMQENGLVYGQMDTNTPPISIVYRGEEIEANIVAKNRQWAVVTLKNGTRGFMLISTKVIRVRLVATNQRETLFYSAPSRWSTNAKLKRRTLLTLYETVNQNGELWVVAKDASGNQGFIEAKTKILSREKGKPTKMTGVRNMVIGGIAAFIGVAITVLSYQAASSSGGTFFVLWGLVAVGIYYFIRGLYQVITA